MGGQSTEVIIIIALELPHKLCRNLKEQSCDA